MQWTLADPRDSQRNPLSMVFAACHHVVLSLIAYASSEKKQYGTCRYGCRQANERKSCRQKYPSTVLQLITKPFKHKQNTLSFIMKAKDKRYLPKKNKRTSLNNMLQSKVFIWKSVIYI